MTANQIAYWKNVETERANKAQEAINQQEADTRRTKVAVDALQRQQEFEYTKKLNLARSISSGFQSFVDWGTGMFRHMYPSGDTAARIGGSILSGYLGGKK